MVREIDHDEEDRLRQILRRGSGLAATWRRAQIALLSAQSTDKAAIAQVAFTSPDPIHDVLHNSDTNGFDSPHPLIQRQAAREIRGCVA